jgi:hypothetical protein
MTFRGVAPVQLVIVTVGLVLWTSLVGIIVLAVLQVEIPEALGTLSIASMTALAGLLAPNTGLLTSKASRRAEAAGQAAAAAVIEAEVKAEDHELDQAVELGNHHHGGPR